MKNSHDDDFAERVARPLRAPEQVRPDFDLRVMSGLQGAVTNTPARRSGSWWRRRRTYRMTALAQLAMAAGIALLVIGAWSAARVGRGGASVVERTAVDTVHVVRFVFVDSNATRVTLVGSFNQWQREATVFQPTAVPGVWMVEVALPPGRHEYAFVVSDGESERWVADPFAPRLRDDFGTESSVISIRPRLSS
jgi:1,4-alpha-glucan branching enzyme